MGDLVAVDVFIPLFKSEKERFPNSKFDVWLSETAECFGEVILMAEKTTRVRYDPAVSMVDLRHFRVILSSSRLPELDAHLAVTAQQFGPSSLSTVRLGDVHFSSR